MASSVCMYMLFPIMAVPVDITDINGSTKELTVWLVPEFLYPAAELGHSLHRL